MKRMLSTMLAAAAIGFGLSMGALAQTPTPLPAPKGPLQPVAPKKPLPPMKQPAPAACDVDPAIARIILTKGPRANEISVRYDVLNLGRSTWRAGANQAQATVVTKNANTGAVTYTHTRALPTVVAGGRTMLIQTSPFRADLFDTFEFGGTVEVNLAYDPDIGIDANRCNDDRNAANNAMALSAEQVNAFMRGTARTQVFNR